MRNLFFSVLILLAGSASAQNLHLIIVADTQDPSIGESCKIDLAGMENCAEMIAEEIDYKLKKHILSAEKCRDYLLNRQLKKVICQKNDILLFYYTGHGKNFGTGDWPRLLLKGKQLKINLEAIHRELQKKGAKLTLTFAEACNTISRKKAGKSVVFKTFPGDKNLYFRDLFLNYEGDILASAAQKGQWAYNSYLTGGFFSNCLRNGLYEAAIAGNEKTDWEQILKKTEICTSQTAKSVNAVQNTNAASGQKPVYRIRLTNNLEPGKTPSWYKKW